MLNAVTFSIIISQTLIAFYLFNTLKIKSNFEKYLNALLVIFFFHVGTKLFLLVGLKNIFLYNNNASGFGLSYGPLLYIITHNYMRKPLQRSIILMHMAPFIVCTLVYFISWAGYLEHILPPAFIVSCSFGYQWVVAASMIVYPFLCLSKLRKYSGGYVNSIITSPPAKLLKQLAIVMLASTVLGLIVAAFFVIKTGYHVFDLRIVMYAVLAAMPVLILRYKMQALVASAPTEKQSIADNFVQRMPFDTCNQAEKVIPRQVNILSAEEHVAQVNGEVVTVNSIEKRYIKSGVDDKMMDRYEVVIKQFMQKTKIYLEAEISLDQLAAKANIPRHHVTQLLNERFKKNFYAFINEYRIAEAKERLQSESNLNILSLAYDCGFNSKSSFNNYFKKVTGLTPSAYRKAYSPYHNIEANNMA